MSKYTTGEIAKICNVTVRTVQYYDNRGILIPSELSEGGRRLYSDEDLKKLKIICFLREIGLPINTISEILKEEDPTSVISLLLAQHEESLKVEFDEVKNKLDAVKMLKSELASFDNFSVNLIGDIARIMKNKDNIKKVRKNMFIYAIGFGALEIATLVLWIVKGMWIPFVVCYIGAALVAALWLVPYYYKKISYICPDCHEVFKPKFWEFFFATHTPKTRKLTCPHCEKKHWCVETYDENSD